MVDQCEDDNTKMTSQQALCTVDKEVPRCSSLKMFIMSLSFAHFCKALSGTYMKSSITQIERRFDLSSSLTGLIDGGFEMGRWEFKPQSPKVFALVISGNLLFLAVVSHFGAKLHRPRIIGSGCFLMALGSAVTGLPHFFMERYKYETIIQSSPNQTARIVACTPSTYTDLHLNSSLNFSTGVDCVKEPGSNMWIYVFLGNALRGIGETPVTPLGISYIDDFAKAENSAFYIACLQTITLLGPMFGFLLGSMCATLYVDVGFVDVDSVTITPKDARWVGAWWLGFIVASVIMLGAGIPFWFFPRSLAKQDEEHRDNPSLQPANQEHIPHSATPAIKLADIAKGFFPSLKKLFGTPVYVLLLCGSVLNFSSLIGLITFKAKYMEQQFGLSASRANFLIGVLNLPVVAVGIFLGGLLMKRYKLSVVSGAQLSFLVSFSANLLTLLQFGTKCDNMRMAGLTVSYNGTSSPEPPTRNQNQKNQKFTYPGDFDLITCTEVATEGVLNLPVVAVGIFLGGLLMKRYKLSVVSGAQLSFLVSFSANLLTLLQFGTKCDNMRMAGLTVSYNGTTQISYAAQSLFSQCNQNCSCSAMDWDPVCSDDGISFMSPCLAGCSSSSGHGKDTVFHNCSCVMSPSPVEGSTSVSLGQCPRSPECSRSFTSYMAVSVLSSFINSLGITPGYMVIIRCIGPELKSLALGIQASLIRTLGGLPAPIYFGALIDTTCLKWGIKPCGGRGACRMYDSDKYRVIFLGLISCLNGSSYFFVIAVIVLLRKQFRKDAIKALQLSTAQVPVELRRPEHQCDGGSGRRTGPSVQHSGAEALSSNQRTEETSHEHLTSPPADPEGSGVRGSRQAIGLDGNLRPTQDSRSRTHELQAELSTRL